MAVTVSGTFTLGTAVYLLRSFTQHPGLGYLNFTTEPHTWHL